MYRVRAGEREGVGGERKGERGREGRRGRSETNQQSGIYFEKEDASVPILNDE